MKDSGKKESAKKNLTPKATTATPKSNSLNKNLKKKPQQEKRANTVLIPVKSFTCNFYQPLPLLKRLNSRRCLALDIDVDKIRYIVAQKSGDFVKVKQWGMQKFPQEITHRFRALQISLEHLKEKLYKPGTEVRVSIFSTDFMIKHEIFPYMKKKRDLERAIFYKYRNELKHFNDDQLVWGYDILDEFEEQGIKKVRVHMVFAPKDAINRYIYIFEHLKLPVEQLISRPAGLLAAYEKMIEVPKSDLLINISYDFTQVCYLKNGNLEYIRNLGIGAHNLEITIRQDGKVSPDFDAEGFGDVKSIDEQESILRKRLLEKLKDLKVKQNPVLHTFFSEILRSIAFIQGHDRRNFIDRILLTGYGIQKESLIPYLKNRLNMPIFIIYPELDNRPPEEQIKFGEFFTTIGTSIQKYQGFNLIPERFKEKLLFRRLGRWLYFIIFLTFIIAGYLSSLQYKVIDRQEAMLEKQKQEYLALNPYEESYNKVIQLIGDVQKENASLQSQVETKPPIIEIMRLFSNLTPKNIRFNAFVFQKLQSGGKLVNENEQENLPEYSVTIEAEIKGDFVNGDVELINFINSLDNLKFFKSINIDHKERNQAQQSINFGLTLTF